MVEANSVEIEVSSVSRVDTIIDEVGYLSSEGVERFFFGSIVDFSFKAFDSETVSVSKKWYQVYLISLANQNQIM